MKGKKPKPTALKKLAGNPGKRALNPGEPQPERKKPTRPRYLSDEAKKVWTRVAGELYQLGLLTRLDQHALAVYCEAVARWIHAQEMCELEGYVITTDKGNLIQSPWVAIMNRSIEQIRQLGAEFGMTPSSRTRIHVERPDNEPTLADILFEGSRSKR